MSTLKLFNKNFLLMVLGQIISIFGNAILRFALPLHILKLTGSAATFGIVLAIPMLPTIILSPFGGMLADRVNRRNIMVALDFITSAIIALFGLIFTFSSVSIVMVVVLMLLSTIQCFYQPAVQASVPLLSSKENLIRSNAIVNQVNSLASLLGPVLGGLLYGFWGLTPIIIVSGVSFFFSAVMEIFIHIPFEKQKSESSIITIIKNDFRDSISFMCREKPIILKATLVVFAFNLFFFSMMLVGIPYIITVILGLSSQLYGFAQGIMSAGALLGGIVVGILASKMKIHKAYWLFICATLSMIPIGFTLLTNMQPMLSYAIIAGCGFVFMAVCTIFSVTMLSFVQRETPNQLIGKVIAFVLTLCTLSQPIGQVMYGFLFKAFAEQAYVAVFLTVVVNIGITFMAKRIFSQIKS